jgi:hypothetical protein
MPLTLGDLAIVLVASTVAFWGHRSREVRQSAAGLPADPTGRARARA